MTSGPTTGGSATCSTPWPSRSPCWARRRPPNDRVVGDVLEQLAAGRPEPLRSYRGALARTSLRLEALELPHPAQRLAWLVENLPSLPGSGIVYTLTRRDAEQVAAFLTANGIAAAAYSGEQQSEERVAIEERLLCNELKAVVATSALGMGYDKADLTFVVHFQAPGSAVSYYQQVGRAGRGVDHADVFLLRGARTAASRTSSSNRPSRPGNASARSSPSSPRRATRAGPRASS